jgi:predicted ATPase
MTVDTQLDTLEAKGLVSVASYQPELEYLFRHALVQDAAYESLLKQERRALHRTVGEALEQLYPDRRGELAAVLAMHFEHAGDSERAVRYAMEAAQFALDRNAIVEAFGLYKRAGALLPPLSSAACASGSAWAKHAPASRSQPLTRRSRGSSLSRRRPKRSETCGCSRTSTSTSPSRARTVGSGVRAARSFRTRWNVSPRSASSCTTRRSARCLRP